MSAASGAEKKGFDEQTIRMDQKRCPRRLILSQKGTQSDQHRDNMMPSCPKGNHNLYPKNHSNNVANQSPKEAAPPLSDIAFWEPIFNHLDNLPLRNRLSPPEPHRVSSVWGITVTITTAAPKRGNPAMKDEHVHMHYSGDPQLYVVGRRQM